QPGERRKADRQPEEELAAEPLAEDPQDEVADRPDVPPPGHGHRPLRRRSQGRPVLDQVEHPDRDEDVADDRGDDTGTTADASQRGKPTRDIRSTGMSRR